MSTAIALSTGESKREQFTWVKDPIEREKLTTLLQLMKEFWSIEHGRCTGNTFDTAVYHLLGDRMWVDGIYEHPQVIFRLIKTMAVPEVANAIKQHGDLNIKDTLNLLDLLNDFFKIISGPAFRIQLDMEQLKSNGETSQSENLDEMIEEYQERVSLATSGKFYYENY